MLKELRVIDGLRGVLDVRGEIQSVEPEYRRAWIDLAEVSAVYYDIFEGCISNQAESDTIRDATWKKEWRPGSGRCSPGMRGVRLFSFDCIAIQVGSKVFYVNEDISNLASLVNQEKRG